MLGRTNHFLVQQNETMEILRAPRWNTLVCSFGDVADEIKFYDIRAAGTKIDPKRSVSCCGNFRTLQLLIPKISPILGISAEHLALPNQTLPITSDDPPKSPLSRRFHKSARPLGHPVFVQAEIVAWRLPTEISSVSAARRRFLRTGIQARAWQAGQLAGDLGIRKEASGGI